MLFVLLPKKFPASAEFKTGRYSISDVSPRENTASGLLDRSDCLSL